MVVCVFDLLFICTIIIKCYSHYTILYVVMLKEKEKDKEKVGSKQFRWLPLMHTTMLTLLAEEAMKGNKPSNTFKASSFTTVAKAIFAQFGVKCYPHLWRTGYVR